MLSHVFTYVAHAAPFGAVHDAQFDTGEQHPFNPHLVQVKGKYDHLIEVCLRFSNGLDSVACFFERYHLRNMIHAPFKLSGRSMPNRVS
jgi:hypothetical protein